MSNRTMRTQSRKAVEIFIIGMLLFHLTFGWYARESILKGFSDFTNLYSAGAILRQGLGSQLYDLRTQSRVQSQVTADQARAGPLPYLHPPFEALLFAVFAYLPYRGAYLAWTLVNLGVMVAVARILRPHVRLLQQASITFWFTASMAFFPMFLSLLQGQDTLLLLLMLSLAFVALQKNSDVAAGCWLGMGLFRFHLILPLVVMLAWQKKFRALISFLAVALFWSLVSVAIVGWREALDYPVYLWQANRLIERQRILFPALMPNLRGSLDFLHRFGIPSSAFIVVLAIGSVALLCFGASRWKSASQLESPLGFSLALNIAVLLGYYTLLNDISLVLLPVLLVVDYAVEHKISIRGWPGAFLLGPVVVLFFSPLVAFFVIRGRYINLIGVLLLVWSWQIGREIHHLSRRSPAAGAA